MHPGISRKEIGTAVNKIDNTIKVIPHSMVLKRLIVKTLSCVRYLFRQWLSLFWEIFSAFSREKKRFFKFRIRVYLSMKILELTF